MIETIQHDDVFAIAQAITAEAGAKMGGIDRRDR